MFFLKIIELLIQRTGYSVSKFGLSAAHNFCKAVQLSLPAADTKQLNNNVRQYNCRYQLQTPNSLTTT